MKFHVSRVLSASGTFRYEAYCHFSQIILIALALKSVSHTTAQIQFPAGACGKVASDLVSGGDFPREHHCHLPLQTV